MALSIHRLVLKIQAEADACKYLEELRWLNEPVCPHCGSVDDHYFPTPQNGTSRATRTGPASQHRVWKCRACRKQFTVLTGTIFHGTKTPVRASEASTADEDVQPRSGVFHAFAKADRRLIVLGYRSGRRGGAGGADRGGPWRRGGGSSRMRSRTSRRTSEAYSSGVMRPS
jgi:transposase-like protein